MNTFVVITRSKLGKYCWTTKHFTTHVQTTEARIKNLEKQVGQLSSDFSKLVHISSNGLPSQTEVNPQVRSLHALYTWAGIEIPKESSEKLEETRPIFGSVAEVQQKPPPRER